MLLAFFFPNLRKIIRVILQSSICSYIWISKFSFLCGFFFLDSQNGQGHFSHTAVLQAHSSFHVYAQRDSFTFCFCFHCFLPVVENSTFCIDFFFLFILIFIFLTLAATRLDVCSGIMEKFRIFRTEKTYAVKAGKWYFEFEAVTAGDMRVGWTRPGCLPDQELGSDEEAFVFDGFKV